MTASTRRVLPTFTWRREINTRHVASADDAGTGIEI
jgi:hypothetical protein